MADTRERPALRVVTRRDVMARVRTGWRHQYYHDKAWLPIMRGSSQDIYAALMRLDIATATREQIDDIIGNDSWTDNICSGCGADVDELVEIGTDEDAPSLCVACLTEGLAALRASLQAGG